MGDAGLILFVFIAIFLTVWFYIILPVKMAGKRKRSAVIWVLISLVFSPLLSILLLFALGDAPSDEENPAQGEA